MNCLCLLCYLKSEQEKTILHLIFHLYGCWILFTDHCSTVVSNHWNMDPSVYSALYFWLHLHTRATKEHLLSHCGHYSVSTGTNACTIDVLWILCSTACMYTDNMDIMICIIDFIIDTVKYWNHCFFNKLLVEIVPSTFVWTGNMSKIHVHSIRMVFLMLWCFLLTRSKCTQVIKLTPLVAIY